jgi:hypothetical protein
MNADHLERALSEDDITPSSGFVTTVMASILQDAQAPAPIPFPWVRAMLGLASAVILLLAVPAVWLISPSLVPISSSGSGTASAVADVLLRQANDTDVTLVVGALLLTYALVDIPRRLAFWR